MKRCPRCDTMNLDDARICYVCHKSLLSMRSEEAQFSVGFRDPAEEFSPENVTEPAVEKRFFTPMKLLVPARILTVLQLALMLAGDSMVMIAIHIIIFLALWLMSRVALNGIPKIKYKPRRFCKFIGYVVLLLLLDFVMVKSGVIKPESASTHIAYNIYFMHMLFWLRFIIYAEVYNPRLEAGPRNPFRSLHDKQPFSKSFWIAMAMIGGYFGLLILLCVIIAIVSIFKIIILKS